MTDLQKSLSKCRVDGTTLFLPPVSEGLLANYAEVKKALINAGAKYKSNTFVFPNEAQPYIDRLMNGDKPNLKQEFQFFATPAKLADKLVRLAELELTHRLFEPEAGQAAIVDAIVRVLPNATVDCCELMDINRNILAKHKHVNLICDDFMKIPKKYISYYDRIIANPPFNNNQDIDHIIKMFECLRKSGRLVSVSSTSWKTGSQRKQVAFREWLQKVEASIEPIEKGEFKESGTAVGGFIITIDKKSK